MRTMYQVNCSKLKGQKNGTKKHQEKPLDRGIAKLQKYLGDNTLIAVSFGKGVGFCVIVL